MSVANVILFGAGRMGAIRARLMYANPLYNVLAIVDPNPSFAQKLADTFHIPLVTSTLAEAQDKLCSTGVDEVASGVVVSSPTGAHKQVFEESADMGLHIFTEKPVDESAEKIKALFEYTDSKGVQLCCGFQRRFDPSYVNVKKAIDAGTVGDVSLANVFFHDSPTPALEFLLTGGDIFMDLAPHDVDYVLWCLGGDTEVESVYATGTSSQPELKAAGVMDQATMLIKTRAGALITISMSRSSSYGYDQRTEFFGTKGCARVNNLTEDGMEIGTSAGLTSSRAMESFPQRFNEGFRFELDEFHGVLTEDKKWPIGMETCMAVQRIADAAGVSAREGRVVML